MVTAVCAIRHLVHAPASQRLVEDSVIDAMKMRTIQAEDVSVSPGRVEMYSLPLHPSSFEMP